MSRVALVSGAARGIGAAIAARLRADGYRVVGVDRLAAEGCERADVGDAADVAALARRLAETHGRLDALVSNAGISLRKPLAALSLADWSAVLATNLTATFLLAQAFAPMLRAARGAIVTIASTRAHQSEPDSEAYAAAKGGLVALTHALAVSLGPAVRVNCISPGWIDTAGAALSEADHAQHPVGRVGTPADVAAMAAFLLGSEAGFVTGAEFIIDGGMTRRMIYVP